MTTQTTTSASTDPSAAERTQEAASTAADEARNVAGTAKEQTAQVASDAVDAAKNVAHDVMGSITDAAREHGGAQRDNLVTTLSALGDDLSSMADQAPAGLAGSMTRQAADQARSLTHRLEGRDPAEILDDVRRFARQRPGLFLLGALGAGVVAGRLLAGARDGMAGAAATPSPPNPPAGAHRAASVETPVSTGHAPDPAAATGTLGQPASVPDFHNGGHVDAGQFEEPTR